MADTELVRIGEVEFLVQIAESGGPQPVGAQAAYSFDGVRDTVEAVAGQLAEVWRKVRPDEASVEFGLCIAAKSGKLLGLLVDGGTEAALKVTLTWRTASADRAPAGAQSAESAGPAEVSAAVQLPDPAEAAEAPALPVPPSAAEQPEQAVGPESGATA
ncbi:MAG TPA: CU044_2847 family protein [Actinocrinis sp.]|nr:CU044_2847 family protein [Actinocrinis sp.]